MNVCVFTGWLPMDADRRRTPSQRDVLTFRLWVKASNGEDQQLCFRCDDQEIVARCAEVMTKGRTVFVRCEACRMELHRMGGVAGDYTGFQVIECEVPNRSKPADEPKADAKPEDEAAA